jgi:hypothetical protein
MRHLVRWTVLVFTCAALAAPAFANCNNPTVTSPTNGSTVTPNIAGTVTLKWSAQVAAAEYDVYFGPVGSGCTAAPHATVNAPTTEWSPPANEISPNTQYEWKVIATGAGLTSCNPPPPQTACSTFTTASCPVAPTLSAPANNSTVAFGSVTLDWNNVPGAVSYDVYGALDGDPLSLLGSTIQSTKSISIEPGRTVEWKVVANAPDCTGQASSHFFFTTTCPTTPPNQLTPGDGATFTAGQNVTFSWSFIAGATSYDLKISDDDGANWELLAENLAANSFTTDDLPEAEYIWEVRANFDGDCEPLYTPTRELIIGADCNNAAPVLIAPAAGATVSAPVTFSWNAVANAEGYRVFVEHTDANAPRLLGTTTATTFTTTDLDAGLNEWHVVAIFDGCPDLSSAGRLLTVESDCPTAKPALVSPANGATGLTNKVQFDWNAVPNATSYRLYASFDGAAEVELAATSATQAEVSVGDAHQVSWNVRAFFAGNCSIRSDSRSFTMKSEGCPDNPGKATLIAPAQNANNLSSPVTFQWNAVPNATGYRVLAAFGNAAPESLGITTSTQLTADVPAGTGYWIVQTFFGDRCQSTLSERRTLTVATGATCTGAAPQLIAPANGAANVASAVEFRWSTVPRATRYRLFVAAGDDQFAFYGETEATSLEALVPAGIVKWFVTAKFSACPDGRSATSTFVVRGRDTCATATIDLLTPSDGATVQSPVPMSWTPVTGALFYRVWVSVDGDAPVNVLRTNATQATIPLPAGDVRWYVDAPRENCEAVVSEEGRFTIARGGNCANNTAPVLITPVGTRENPASANTHVTLAWNEVPNAIGYRVWLSSDLRSFEDVALTKLLEVEIDLEGGTYAWFVAALFSGCDSKQSPVAFFRVFEVEPRCPTDEPAVISPGAGDVTTSPVTISWTAVERAVKYRVFASLDGSEPLHIGTTEDTELTRALSPGQVAIAIEAVFEECPSTFSDRVSFTIGQSGDCADEGAELVSPGNGATNVESPVDFVWNAVSGAVKYILVAQVNDGAPTAIASTEDTQVTHAMPPGVIRWKVITFFAGCDPVESDTFRFTIARDQDCDNRKPILLLPRDGDSVPSPVHFQWTAVPNAIKYLVWARKGDNDPSIVASTTEADADVDLAEGTYEYFVEAHFEGDCPPTESARGEFEVIAPVPCGKPAQPKAQVVGQALSNTRYRLRWTPLPNVQFYEVQESTSLDFSNATTFTTKVPVMAFSHEVTGAPVQYLYRVRAVSDCSEDRGPFSDTVGVFVIAPRTNNASAEIGSESNVIQTVFLPGSTTPLQFVATADKPWATITPSQGTLPVEGITLTVTANSNVLHLGTNTVTINVTYSGGSGKSGINTEAGTISKIPLSVSLVTPVIPTGKGTPPPDALIFPVVGHAAGANDSLFESDIRITNLTAQTARYDVHFTPSNTDGTQTGSSSTIEIAPNATLALDDIVASLFGTGTTSSATGTLEVRPLETTASSNFAFFDSTSTGSLIRELATAASSRTYNFTPNGTFGQFIPAIPFSDFVGRSLNGVPAPILSLQQVAQSADYRANFGFTEAAGASADLSVRVYDTANNLLATIPVALQPGEHRQLNGMLSTNGITNLADGRVEVEVIGGEGKVTAYVSEVDNRTNDPLLVSAVKKGAITANKYVVPGVAYLNNPGAFWVTDMRIFNAGSTATPATLTFYPERNPAGAISRDITLNPGEIEVLDNVLVSLFGATGNMGGAIAVTTPANTQLTATARTYNKTTNGTFGQYVPGVTPAQSVGAEDRALQLLQLEQSSRFRTNIGVNETSGQPVTIEVGLIVPDLIASPFVTIELQPNEFQQFSLANFGLGNALYNARVTVKVVGGTGRVTAYASAIDQITQDPTYVPAQ